MIELSIHYDLYRRRFFLSNMEIQTAYPEMKDNVRDFVDDLNRLPYKNLYCSLLFFTIIGVFFILSFGLLYLDMLWIFLSLGLLIILLLLIIFSEFSWKAFKNGVSLLCKKYEPIFEGFYLIENNFDSKESSSKIVPYSIVLKAQMIDYAIDLTNQYYAIKGAIPLYVYEEKEHKFDDGDFKKPENVAFGLGHKSAGEKNNEKQREKNQTKEENKEGENLTFSKTTKQKSQFSENEVKETLRKDDLVKTTNEDQTN